MTIQMPDSTTERTQLHERKVESMQRNVLESIGWTKFRCSTTLSMLAGEVLDIARIVFALPESEKSRFCSPETNYQSGWRNPNVRDRPTEVWHISHTDPNGTWPIALASERLTILELLDQSRQAVGRHLDTLVQDFGGVPGELCNSLERGNSVVRLLYYGTAERTGRFPRHTDFGIASLFVAETCPGLELQTGEEEWRLAGLSPDNWILAAGEMLATKSDGVIPAALHRVITPENERWAVAIFLHPDKDYCLGQDEKGDILTAEVFFDALMKKIMRAK